MIGDQIKELRKTLGLSQTAFATRIKSKQSTITNYETGRNDPNDSVIDLIVREFGCDETWLRTGEGEPYPELTWVKKVSNYVGKVMLDKGAGAELQQMALDFFSEVPPEIWQELGEKARIVIERHYPKK